MNYYKGGKRVLRDGAPCKVAAWVGELGNDAEYREATKPRDSYKAIYYADGYRLVKNGIPCRFAGYVSDWSPWMKGALLKGSATTKEASETERQAKILLSPTQ